jgi:hypothetical protein
LTKAGNVDDELVKTRVEVPEDEVALPVDLAVNGIFVLRAFEFDACSGKRSARGGIDYVAFH